MPTHSFQADTTRVLSLVIDSLYSDKHIFLRELVSNAADALDKLRFAALTAPALLADQPELRIRLRPDRAAGTLQIEDTGLGMSEAELIEHLGTIARSGTRAFLERLEEQKKRDVTLIGQFGVGFYSSFLVASQVQVDSRSAGSDQAYRWRSDGKDSFEVSPIGERARGTTITLTLKPEQQEYLEPHTLRQLVRKFSDFVSYPIELVGADADGHETIERINRGTAPWQQPPSSLDDAQHSEIYQHLTRDVEAPLAHLHFRAEGQLEYVALLYIPRHAGERLFESQKAQGLQLYVKRVLVLDPCEALLPPHLRFVRGLIDTDDLPLNVSRELLQDSAALRAISRQLSKRVLDRLEALADEKPEDYKLFSEQFGSLLKEGLASGEGHDGRLAKLVRFGTSHDSGVTSLSDYVARMPEGQPAIYYATAEHRERLQFAPQLEALRARGYEVLLGTEPIDEFALERLGEFDGKKLLSALRPDLELPQNDEQKAELERAEGELSPLLVALKASLGEQVQQVVASSRLTDSPACLVLGEHALPAHLERLFRQRGHELPRGARVLELNPGHPLIRSLLALAVRDAESAELARWGRLLLDQAALAEGSELRDAGAFAREVTELMGELLRLRAASAESAG